MTVQVQKSTAAAKLGSKVNAAIAEGANSTSVPETGFPNLPPGITNGIARLEKCGFVELKADTKKKKLDGSSAGGEFQFTFAAVCVFPKQVIPVSVIPGASDSPVVCAGRQTRVWIDCFDTATGEGATKKVRTQAQSINDDKGILAYMRLMGGETYTKGCDSIEKLERLAAQLQQANPPIYFGFTTSETYDEKKKNPKTGKPYPPRTWENWQAAIPDYTPPDASTSAFNDNSEPPTGEHEVEEQVAEETPIEAVSEATTTDIDLNALVTAASKKKPDAASAAAGTKLTELALAAGYSKEEVEADDATWDAVATMIRNPKTEGEVEESEETVEEEGPWAPAVGVTVTYNRPGTSPTTKKAYTPFACEVKEIAADGKLKLKSLVDNKTVYGGVKPENVSQPVGG